MDYDFYIDGVNITPYLAHRGIKWQRQDIDGVNSGRLLNGDMQRDRVATKIRFDLTTRPLYKHELKVLLSLLQPVFVTVNYTDPRTDTYIGGTFYSNNLSVGYIMPMDGSELWDSFTFPLIQK